MYLTLPGGYAIWDTENGPILRYYPKVLPSDAQGWPHITTFGPKVDGYHVYRKIITGKITPYLTNAEYAREHMGDDSNSDEMRKGYFIIDLHTNKEYGGLSKPNWLAKLKSYGITREPILYVPSWRDRPEGRTRPQAESRQ